MTTPQSICPFCNISREVLAENDLAFAIFDMFPVSNGHVLIIPRRHISVFFELTESEQIACIQLSNQVKQIIQNDLKPDGFNIGINIGESAGQTISHAHIHIIPRYIGDVDNPRGGVRGVIPDKKEY